MFSQRAVLAGPICRATARPICSPAARPRPTAFVGAAELQCGASRLAGSPLQEQLGSRLRRREGATGPVRVQALAVGWVAAGAALLGVVVGLAMASAAQAYFRRDFNPQQASIENAQLRAKVEELQQMVTKFEPLAYKDMKLRFTKGVNKSVILGLVDELLTRKEVNIWWLPDSIERMLYLNVMTLMLSVLDEIVDGMSMNFAGHNVKMTLAYLDLSGEGGAGKSGGGQDGGQGSSQGGIGSAAAKLRELQSSASKLLPRPA